MSDEALFPNRYYVFSFFMVIGIFILIIIAIKIYFICDLIICGDIFNVIISLLIGFISVAIAFYSMGLARKSDIRMRAIADSTFLEIIGIYEDKRLSLRQKRLLLQRLRRRKERTVEYRFLITEYQIELSFSIWKCLTYIRRASVFMKWFTPSYKNSLIHLTAQYFSELRRGIDFIEMTLTPENRRHLQEMYNFVSSFDIYKEHKDRDLLEKEKEKLLVR